MLRYVAAGQGRCVFLIIAVSYTHLDVYKRQVVFTTEARQEKFNTDSNFQPSVSSGILFPVVNLHVSKHFELLTINPVDDSHLI